MGRQVFGVLLATLAIVSPLLIHVLLTRSHSTPAAGLLIALQLLLTCCFVLARTARRYRAVAVAAFAACALVLGSMHVNGGLILSSALPHALAYSMLLALFASSLKPGREPLVSFFARKIHGALTPAVADYTRRVTWAWCLFFSLQLAGSALLLACAPVGWWSLFVNVLNAPLVFLMLIGERVGRPLWLVDAPQERLFDMIALFRRLGREGLRQDMGLP